MKGAIKVMNFYRVNTQSPATPWSPNRQQKVTVPAWSSTSLYLPLCSFSPVQLCLIVLSALFSLPPSWVCLVFFPLSLFPFSLPPLHYFIDSLSLRRYVRFCFKDYKWTSSHSVTVRLLCKCDCARAATCTGVWRGERRGPQAHICKSRDKSRCVVFAASPRVKQ